MKNKDWFEKELATLLAKRYRQELNKRIKQGIAKKNRDKRK